MEGKGKNILDGRKSLAKPLFKRQCDVFEQLNVV